MIPEKFTFEHFEEGIKILSEEHDLSEFCCDFEDESGVDDFIHFEALGFQTLQLGTTYLFYYKEKCLGFITLAMASIRLKELEEEEADKMGEKAISSFPSLLIGQLGTHNDFRRKGIGSILIEFALGMADSLSNQIGCRYVSLVTRPGLVHFYQKLGFSTKNPGKERVVMAQRVG